MTLETGQGYPFGLTSDGGLIIAGETSLRFSDLWLSKVDTDGKEIWKKTFEQGEKLARVDAVSQTSDGGYLIAGKNISCCGWGDFDLWLVKTDDGANVQWKKSFEEFRYVSIYSIQETSDGNYIFAGNRGCELWIGKFDKSGKELWSRSFSGFGYKDFRKTPDGGYIASGEKRIMKIDAEGKIQWMTDFEKEGITSLMQSADGGLFAAGYIDSEPWLVKLKRSAIPFVSITPDFPGAGQPVTFDASLSYDPDGNIEEYRWDFGDGNITGTKDKKIVHSYASEGSYNVSIKLLRKDKTAMDTRSQQLEVQRSIPPHELWSRTYGGNSGDVEKSADQTSDEGYIMAGDTTFLYGISAYLVKTGPDGNEEWNRTYGGIDGQTGAKSVVQTSDGGYVFAGAINLQNQNAQMIWLVKTDPKGNEMWNRTFGRPGSKDDFSYNDAFSVIEDSGGNYVVAGISDMAEGISDPRFGLLLAKTDKDWNKLWEKTWDQSGSIEAYSVIESVDSSYTVVGTTYLGGLTNAWLMKADQNGNQQWIKTYGGTGRSPIAHSVKQTTDGDYIVAGNMWKYEPDAGNIINLWIMKTDTNGNKLWEKTYERRDYGSAKYVRESKDGGYLILADGGGAGIWLIKTDVNGSVQWHDKLEGNDPSSVIETSDSGYIVGGVKDDSCGNQGSDFWLIKLGGSKIGENETEDPAVENETSGRDEQQGGTKVPGFEGILMISAMIAAFVVRKK